MLTCLYTVVGLPAWEIHTKVYELLGLSTPLCQVIDHLVDVEPPKVKEIIMHEDKDERLPVHFGFNKSEFPYMYNYVLRKYGLEGTKCLLMHFILDYMENNLARGHTHEMIKSSIETLLYNYGEECRIVKDLCTNYRGVAKEIKELLNKHMEQVISEVENWVSRRLSLMEVLLNASSNILSLMMRLELYLRGYRGKKGFTVDRKVFNKTFAQAKYLLKQKVFEAILNNELKDLNKIIESINKIKQQLSVKHRATVSDFTKALKDEQNRNPEFDTFIKIIRKVVMQVIKDYEKSRG